MMRFAKAAALAAGTLLTLAPAASATTYTVAVGGSTTVGNVPFTATTGGVEMSTNYGLPLTCTSSILRGDVLRGATFSPPTASVIATITDSTWTGCLQPTIFNTQFTITQVGTWNVKADSSPVDGVFTGTITNIDAEFHSVVDDRCEYDVTGTVDYTFDSNTQTLNIDEGNFALTISNVVGCFGEVMDGDLLDFTGGWPMQPTTYAFSTTGGNVTVQ
ncbi:hypothetical protein [Aeromicrobium sp. IC_218]|uniref:hypothetical protein n=1 Tax=Aeromicrobium sp. IC_218 TaxID=2545468 RepID=UPI00103FC12F|nr:hypothetical protein [Aeromicrobium sp. IC_218]TCI98983.1 hypothetical protein E0W78_09580 [Aeromicrobium sp. IC_218]